VAAILQISLKWSSWENWIAASTNLRFKAKPLRQLSFSGEISEHVLLALSATRHIVGI
jgi:hypothetical protein